MRTFDSLFTVRISQRIDELRLFLSLELWDTEEEVAEIKREMKSLIQNKLNMYDWYETSSDDEKKSIVQKVVQKKSTEEVCDPPSKVRNRLPGVTEKWNEDLSEHEAQLAEMSTDDEDHDRTREDEREEPESQSQSRNREEPLYDDDAVEEPYDNTDPYEGTEDVDEDEAERQEISNLLVSSDSEGEQEAVGQIVIDNRGLDTSISSRNSAGSNKNTREIFTIQETQFTPTEDPTLSPIMERRRTQVPISRPFTSSKKSTSSVVSVTDPKTKSAARSNTRSSQQSSSSSSSSSSQIITQPLASKTQAAVTRKRAAEKEDVESDENNVYNWEKNTKKSKTRTR